MSVGKQDKGMKYNCRVREVSNDKLEKLYKNINRQCQNCIYDCKNAVDENVNCNNKNTGLDINEINRLLREENVNLSRLCDNYSLKLYIMLDMLRGNRFLQLKYYTCLMDRLHMVKDGTQMNNEYQMLVRKAGVGIQ
jgi:hypothetical protein